MKLSLSAPAKINWFLSVAGRRDDGYHDIVSPMQCVTLFDNLTFEDAGRLELVSDLDVPVSENLVYRAAALLKKHTSYAGGARICLRKDIPLAAGLGGGSSDAACTLMGLNRLWRLRLGREDLMELGARIGSDVPFFIDGPFALIEGRGERVTHLRTEGSVAILLVKPDIPVSAAWAYHSYKTELTKKLVDIKLFCQALAGKDFASLGDMVFNDLEHTVIGTYPVVAEIKKKLKENGACVASMSGSGPTVFGVFNTADEAYRASAAMGKNWCRVVETLGSDKKQEVEIEG